MGEKVLYGTAFPCLDLYRKAVSTTLTLSFASYFLDSCFLELTLNWKGVEIITRVITILNEFRILDLVIKWKNQYKFINISKWDHMFFFGREITCFILSVPLNVIYCGWMIREWWENKKLIIHTTSTCINKIPKYN